MHGRISLSERITAQVSAEEEEDEYAKTLGDHSGLGFGSERG